MIKSTLNIASSLAATLLRTGVGINSEVRTKQPEKLLKLYDIEASPYCRLVREVLTELDLDVEIYPCPSGGERYREWVKKQGGKSQFPYLVDPNTGVELYDSKDIIEYLFKAYSASGKLPFKWQFTTIHKVSSVVTSLSRAGLGSKKSVSKPPEKLLELYSFESSPYARLVREVLCEMEIPYILRNAGRSQLSEWILPPVRNALGIKPESELHNRKVLQETTGNMSIPYLIDHNTGVAMYESQQIIDYLQAQYG